MWMNRCYSDGIPDDVPAALVWSGRVPSWRAVALCILRNDLRFRGLGFQDQAGRWGLAFMDEVRRDDSQLTLGI
jgi:predicted phosphoadenosine phosphosulfate sulfurtransferase